jgi:hypothetical protein
LHHRLCSQKFQRGHLVDDLDPVNQWQPWHVLGPRRTSMLHSFPLAAREGNGQAIGEHAAARMIMVSW